MLYVLSAFLLVFILTAYVHTSNNRHYFNQWKKIAGQDTATRLNQFAWARTAQLLSAIAGGAMAVLLLNYFQVQHSNDTLAANTKNIETRLAQLARSQQSLLNAQHVMQEHFNQQQAAMQAQMEARKNLPFARIPQIEISAKTITPAGAASPPAAAGNPQGQPVTLEDVYNPEAEPGDKQSVLDAIKKRYEGLLVNYLFLKKCKLIDAQDYHAIISTLSREMASVNAPGRLEDDILTAAKGSYNEMYANSACTGPETEKLHRQYDEYIKTISSHIPTQ